MKHFALLVATVAVVMMTAPVRAADTYKVDPVHSAVIFRAHHANIGYVYGRFNDFGGTFSVDEADPGTSTFEFRVQAASVDTRQEKRDAHLKSPDFLNAKQYPTITFKSTAVKKGDKDNVLEVVGDLTLHGVTKPITVPVEITGKGQFPPGTQRTGLEAVFTVKTSEFDIKGLPGVVGDEIRLIVAAEGAKQ
ncbi:MAG TPA: YceI family protein [Tepidisphaeraceae bacterium]